MRRKKRHVWVGWRGNIERCARPGCDELRRPSGSAWEYRSSSITTWGTMFTCRGDSTSNTAKKG